MTGMMYYLERGTVNWVNRLMCDDRPALPFDLANTQLRTARDISSSDIRHLRAAKHIL